MQNKFTKTIGLVAISLFYFSCTTYKPFYAKSEKDWKKANNPDSLSLSYTVFLIGDVGKPDIDQQEPTLKLLQSQMYQTDTVFSADKSDTTVKVTSSPKDAVIFMGDNIYEHGMPKPDAPDRKLKEQYIIEQMKVVKDFKGKKIFIPGNHDWDKSHPDGLETLKREEDFVENYLDSADVFLPTNGCAGPVEIQMNGNLVIIAIDSEWWLTPYHRSDRHEQGCSVENDDQLIAQIKDILIRNKGKNIVFTEHHPLFSNGKHGGHFTFLDYMFPLTLVRDNLYIPLPGLGSLYPLLRQYGLSREDISNKHYQDLKNRLLATFNDEKSLVIASGHEHALQLTPYKNIHQVISGAGSKNSALSKGNGALFGHGTKGFARLNYYSNGQCWVEFWEPVGDGSKGKLMYRSPLYSLPAGKKEVIAEKKENYSDSTKFVAVGERYKASKFKQWVFGEHYRTVWATPITIPYLDLTKFAGGLKPLQLGGGHQTTSLRLEGKNKIQYQFRTIDKDPSALLPEGFRPTFADDIVQDQISSAHPYGALAIPGMAAAIGVFHTDPKVVYMPYSRLLGPYLQQIGGRIGIIEIRPDEDLSAFKEFGYTKNAVSTETMYEKLKKDNDNSVDQKSFLTARLFDMLIGDWDRHEDQWRWAEFENKGKGAVYKPIPRDRDQVFTKFDGLLPKLASKAIPDVQNFGFKIEDPAKLSTSARNLDRRLLNELTYQDWISIAKKMQKELTDKVIENSVRQMPKEAYALSGDDIVAKLKSRRDQLVDVAKSYYKTLAKEVTVSGSDKHEFLNIDREKDSTAVTMYKTKKDGKIDKIIYNRIFNNDDTHELNFYLLDDTDSLVIKGKSDYPIKIRVVGGKKKDYLADDAENGKTIFFDNLNTTFKTAGNTDVRKSDKDWVNEYLPNNFNYDKKSPFLNADYRNGKDGPLLGLVYNVKHYGFRKEPYSYEEKFSLLHSLTTKGLFAKYNATFYDLLAHKYDLVVKSSYSGPAYKFNYYGIGNGTQNIDDKINFYRVRSETINVATYFQYHISDDIKFGIGPGFDYFRIIPYSDPNYLATLNLSFTNPAKFLSLKSYLNFSFVDNDKMPKTGFKWENAAEYFAEIKGESDKYLHLSSMASFYATPNGTFPVTFALRLGAMTNIGSYKFYQANSIGNRDYLRGFRNERFSGKSAYFANTEVRLPVSSFRNYIFTGDFGVYGFYDIAKVRNNFAESRDWHQGFGPGLYINFYNKLLVSAGYGFSRESKLISFDFGFRF
ncbi:metallophosphoesterase [Pedobacter sp. SD-b]|uniref:Metallophosphoesterase n=1 Tax=Pedobacter segetis TaxID=2793069 RepID=A0ABS1BMR7_9SPHI|nr:metallophosphoesterase [Pedobacter segetis]MBK0384175.1 metallophosphoesterase [Pedobacter segetis]